MASLPPKELSIFEALCECLPQAEVQLLRDRVAAHVAKLEAEQARSELVALDLAVLLKDRLDRLFDFTAELSDAERALVVGAARYFTSRDDAIPDARACTGLDDDVRVLNRVMRRLGRTEWLIEE